MLSIEEKIFMALVVNLFLLVILVNGFIFLVNCFDWVKSKKLPPRDLILINLAISRISFSCGMLWKSYLILFSFDIPTNVRVIDVFLVLSHNSNIWFATILSIFYFLKITNFSNPLFLWMKWRIDKMILMLLWGPFIISLFIIFPMMERMYYYGNFFIRKEKNESQEIQASKSKFHILQILYGLLNLIPLILSTISFSLLILSLRRHTRQMQLNATGSRDPSTKAHVRAMKAVSSFLILILFYYICFLANCLRDSKEISKLTSILSILTMLLYPFGHSVILILWNSKLRQASFWVWQQALFCLRGEKT